MAYRIIQIGSVAIILLFYGCVSSPSVASEMATVAGWEIRLVERDATCLVTYAKEDTAGEHTLVPTPPCRFVGEAGSVPQIVQFNNHDKRFLIIVFGSPYLGKPPAKLASEGVYCGTVSQAIVVTSQAVRLSKRVAKGGLRCEGRMLDKLEFELFDEATDP